MSEHQGFLQAIADSRRDNAPRLVYADWLDERGDPRGEYLRLDYQLSQVLCRLDELRGQIEPAWLTAVRRTPRGVGEIRLHDGRIADVSSIRQELTYGGLLEGLPTDRLNQRIIEGLLRGERGTGTSAEEPYLVPPTARPIKLHDDRPYPFGTPEALPAVTCVAHLTSSPARDTMRDGSALTVIWFQDDYAFPIDPHVLDHLHGLDWKGRATDFDC